MMIVGSLWLDLHVPGVRSLKEKRRIIKSVKEKLKGKFNVSIAEVGALDQWQRAELGVACVSNDRAFVDRTLNLIVDRIAADPALSIIDRQEEIF
jgi:uncharacterized protein